MNTQKLVNAQTEINRAVFEANKPNPRKTYVVARILMAQNALTAALALTENARCRHPRIGHYNMCLECGDHVGQKGGKGR